MAWASSASLMRMRSSRITVNCSAGFVLMTTRMSMPSDRASRRPRPRAARATSPPVVVAPDLVGDFLDDALGLAAGPRRTQTVTSSTLRAHSWLLLPTRVICPFGTYQTVPFTSRSRVVRRPTASTVPDASPRSMMSPTPYWSSTSMKMPERKSFTRLCAPKPRAMPTMPALATSGPRLMPSSPRIVTPAML